MNEQLSSNPEQLTQAENFISVINKKFEENIDQIRRDGPAIREHEEEIMLYPTFQFHDVPSADRFFISRPIPEEEGLALEKWEYFGGHIVTVHEAQGKIQTDYHVRDGRVYRRRKNGGFVVPHFVPLVPLKGEKQDTLTLSALGKSTVKGKNIGEPVSSKMGEEIINWIETAQIEKMDS